jgi:hypothetical protein
MVAQSAARRMPRSAPWATTPEPALATLAAMSGRHRSRASVLVPIALAVALAACDGGRSSIAGVTTGSRNTVHPPQLDLVGSLTCRRGDWGFVSASGRVVNRSSERSGYAIDLAFGGRDDRLGEATEWIDDLGPGESRSFETVVHLGERSGLLASCSVLSVERWSVG